MPKRKQEQFEERREQIMDGALKVFADKGFIRATNRDVAEAAGINSPGLIYHYFKDKSDLLRAVIEHFAAPMQLLAHPERMMEQPPREALTHFGRLYLELLDDPKMGALLRLVIGEALREPTLARFLGEVGPLRVWRFLAEYLRRQMNAGVLRQADPEIAARLFVGPLVLHLATAHILQLPDPAYADRESYLAACVDLFLRGLEPATD